MIKKTIIISSVAIAVGLGFMLIPYDALLLYSSNQNRNSSPESQRDAMPIKNTKEKPIFVIQKHNATTLHYDFRLEIDGTLKSWAVPKGPSTDPQNKHLAIETEDHPMEYANFEGEIPEGNYGTGQVIIWDRGTFDNIKEKNDKPVSLKQSYNDGHIEVDLHGKKLRGGYALIRTAADDDAKKWLLIKMRDEYADARRNPVNTEPKSIVSGKTIEEMASTKKKLKK